MDTAVADGDVRVYLCFPVCGYVVKVSYTIARATTRMYTAWGAAAGLGRRRARLFDDFYDRRVKRRVFRSCERC